MCKQSTPITYMTAVTQTKRQMPFVSRVCELLKRMIECFVCPRRSERVLLRHASGPHALCISIAIVLARIADFQ